MHWIDKISNSKGWAFFLCGLLFSTGFLFGSSLPDTPFLVMADSIGSFLSGIGTIAAVFFAISTYKDWKKLRYHEITVESYHTAISKSIPIIGATVPLKGLLEKDQSSVLRLKELLSDSSLIREMESYEVSLRSALILNGNRVMLEHMKVVSVSWNRMKPLLKSLEDLPIKEALAYPESLRLEQYREAIEQFISNFNDLNKAMSSYFQNLAVGDK